MVFVVDIGNTNVTFAGIRGEEICLREKLPTEPGWSEAAYLEKIRPIVGDPTRFRGAIVSSVVPAVTATVGASLEKLMGTAPIIMGPDTLTGLQIDLPEPDKVGRDRLVDAVWAVQNLPLPAVTADLGTASTFNVILPGGVFVGGIICAGIQTGLHALAARTAQLPRLELRMPSHVIGRTTEECMISGAVAGTAALVDGLVTQIEEELDCPVSLAITGGGGRYVSPRVHHAHVYDFDLTLKGLALVYEKNAR